MTVPYWQPGTEYEKNALVQSNEVGGITQAVITNADFESGNSDWTLDAAMAIDGTPAPFVGSFSLNFTFNDVNPISAVAANDDRRSVSVGQVIRARCQATTSSTKGSVQIGVSFYASGGALLETIYGTAESPSEYSEIDVEATAPADSVTVSVTCKGSSIGSGIEETGNFDNVVWDHFFHSPFNTIIFKATQTDASFSGSAEPVWPTVLTNTVVDNGVTWEAVAANLIVWKAVPILKSDSSEPTFPTEDGATVLDNTVLWVTEGLRIQDSNCPNTKEVAILASKIFAGDKDIVAYSATINPLDWTTADDAGFIPFGLNTYGSQDVTALGIYRSNLVIFNGKAFQMWQVDEDPANFAILDAVPVGCRYPRSLSPVSNDLVFLTDEGIRSMGIAGASTNLQAGFFGKQIDPLILAAIKGGEIPDALYFPGAGQYWLFFGEEAFVLTMNGDGIKDMSWSRYVFPSAIDDWTILGSSLYLRSGDKVWLVDDDTLIDDSGGANVTFAGQIWWPYLDFGAIGVTKQMIGFDVVAEGEFSISFGYNQKDASKFTAPYTISGDTLVGDIIPMPLAGPSFQTRLVFTGNTAWEWSATIIYLQDWRRTS